MSRRPSARFAPAALEQPGASVAPLAPIVHGDARYRQVVGLRALRAEEIGRIRAIFERHPDREFYSVEVAIALGIGAVDTHVIVRIVGRLHALQRDGVLDSRFEPAPLSGLGRRYYRLRPEA